MLQNRSDFKFDCIKSLEITPISRMAPFDRTCENLTLAPKNYVTTLVFVRRIEGKLGVKMVIPEVVETRETIKFCVKLGNKQSEMFSILQGGGDALEMKKYNV